MYAIDCDLEQDLLVKCDPKTYRAISAEVKRVLADYGFSSCTGSVFWGTENIDGVSAFRCIFALNELTKKYSCLHASLKNVKILEIDEDFSPELSPPPPPEKDGVIFCNVKKNRKRSGKFCTIKKLPKPAAFLSGANQNRTDA
ncbi:hypothetical protein H0R92_04160 [Treponema sp. OMZ 840]|uniref:hypothetical protein n=1 Tax=Treponema sp. OMZ 840 TaxID=244313 RepID=UPI003D93F993